MPANKSVLHFLSCNLNVKLVLRCENAALKKRDKKRKCERGDREGLGGGGGGGGEERETFARISQTRYTFSSFVVALNLNGSRNFCPRSTHISSKADVSRHPTTRLSSSSSSFSSLFIFSLLSFFQLCRDKTARVSRLCAPKVNAGVGPSTSGRPFRVRSTLPSLSSGAPSTFAEPPLFPT